MGKHFQYQFFMHCLVRRVGRGRSCSGCGPVHLGRRRGREPPAPRPLTPTPPRLRPAEQLQLLQQQLVPRRGLPPLPTGTLRRPQHCPDRKGSHSAITCTVGISDVISCFLVSRRHSHFLRIPAAGRVYRGLELCNTPPLLIRARLDRTDH